MRAAHRLAETTLTLNSSVGFESKGDFSISAMTSSYSRRLALNGGAPSRFQNLKRDARPKVPEAIICKQIIYKFKDIKQVKLR
jgi:hypothetical protein